MKTLPQLEPLDEHNRRLKQAVHPDDWVNPTPPEQGYQMVVIGAGTAGLVTAAGAAGLGARVALIERELMGGDCLNVGCVPSKAVIRAGRAAADVRTAGEFGVQVGGEVKVDFAAAMEWMRRRRADISPNDSAERFRSLGVDVYFGRARFEDERTVVVETDGRAATRLPFRRAVIATGARAAAPPIPGLDSVSYLTNETVFSLTERPERLAVIGGGPIGVELAQAFARLGVEVTVFEMAPQILIREDPDAAAIVARRLEADGVRLRVKNEFASIQAATDVSPHAVRIRGSANGNAYDEVFDRLLVAVGRAPNVEGLGLEEVGVACDRQGIQVNDRLQTTNPRIYAAGDVASRYKFTHAADFMARIVIQNALFRIGPFGARRASDLLIPWCTYTSPEIAHVGKYASDAEKEGIAIDTFTQPLAENDRAILEGETDGFVRVHVCRGTDRIVGATIVGPHAGDLISELTVAMQHGVGLGKISGTIHPYPTLADAVRRLGDQYNRTRLTPRAKSLLGVLLRWNVGK